MPHVTHLEIFVCHMLHTWKTSPCHMLHTWKIFYVTCYTLENLFMSCVSQLKCMLHVTHLKMSSWHMLHILNSWCITYNTKNSGVPTLTCVRSFFILYVLGRVLELALSNDNRSVMCHRWLEIWLTDCIRLGRVFFIIVCVLQWML